VDELLRGRRRRHRSVADPCARRAEAPPPSPL